MVLLNTAAFAELTVSDLEKIQAIAEKSEMQLKKELKEDIHQEIKGIDTKIDGIEKYLAIQTQALEKHLAIQNQALEKHNDRMFWLQITLIGGLITIIAAIGGPNIVKAFRQPKSTPKDLLEPTLQHDETAQQKIKGANNELQTQQ
jgi:hypothetical protein